MTDKELLGLLRSNPEQGLAAVVEQYSGYVLKIAYTRLSSVCSQEDIEEAASDVFLKFFEAAQKRDFVLESVRGMLSLIGGRHCINVFKKHCRRAEEVPLDETIEFAAGDATAPEQLDEHTALAKALHSLGEQDEEIFIRKYFFGQSSSEIAQRLGMKTNTVDKRISRGLVRLRKILEEEE